MDTALTLSSSVPAPAPFTFVATENVGAVCELIDDDGLQRLLAESEQSEG